jgi:hypothetical protein
MWSVSQNLLDAENFTFQKETRSHLLSQHVCSQSAFKHKQFGFTKAKTSEDHAKLEFQTVWKQLLLLCLSIFFLKM